MNFEGKRAALHTLGCKVNEYETDAMRSCLESAGFTIVDFREKADVYVINTCSVTNIADRKSRQMISRAKRSNPDAVVVAAGCYVQTALERTGKNVDADILLGSGRKSALVEELGNYFRAMEAAGEYRSLGVQEPGAGGGNEAHSLVKTPHRPEAPDSASADRDVIRNVSDVMKERKYDALSLPRIEGHTRAFIKVQDGCNMFCSYCIIPFARGRVRSRDMEDILDELRGLASQGIREVVLTGIHLSSYGVDFDTDVASAYGTNGEGRAWQTRSKLIDLIEAVSGIEGIERIRLGSLEPTIITEEFVERLSRIREVCPHFHLSLQSGCDSVLRRMNRHYTTQEYMGCLELLRSAYDRPAITTDVIAGFPGESGEEFESTVRFLNEAHFYETHLFRFSMRAGTRAARMEGQIPESVKEERLKALAELDRRMRGRFESSWDGMSVEALIEEAVHIDENGRVSTPNSGRAGTSRPEIHLPPGETLYTGYTREYMRVFVLSKNDLRGKIITGKINTKSMVIEIDG
ncbi:MAG: tRNA (N(6)-L-threonylcarbamoyladenosine(37)-C(2))-methylthiotransferase MtaB [Lachnospiraceae bacterium]|nr:tRNA (N(6)-L-threonylcarbamoyladenosine(37)-C(2))-methylthiotransferase MtaB [Lachnospiraceae bacterium]